MDMKKTNEIPIFVSLIIVAVLFSYFNTAFGQTGFNDIDRMVDELKRLEILKVILDYQNESGEYNTTWLTNERIANEIFGWYKITDPQPEITEQVIIDKYKETINNPPPEPTIDERLDALFN